VLRSVLARICGKRCIQGGRALDRFDCDVMSVGGEDFPTTAQTGVRAVLSLLVHGRSAAVLAAGRTKATEWTATAIAFRRSDAVIASPSARLPHWT